MWIRAIAIFGVTAAFLLAADASGKWVFERQGRGGTAQVTMNLKASGSSLTGNIDAGRGGPIEITNGKINDDRLSFDVEREAAGRKVVTHYSGVIRGDEMTLDFTTGNSDFASNKVTVTARRCPPDCK